VISRGSLQELYKSFATLILLEGFLLPSGKLIGTQRRRIAPSYGKMWETRRPGLRLRNAFEKKKQDDAKVSKLGTRTPDTFRFCSQPLQNDANLVSSKKYTQSFDSVDECNLPVRCDHFAPERGYHCYTQEKHNHYPNYHKYSYNPQSSYRRETHPETKYSHQDFASHEPVTSTSHANSVIPTDKKYSLSFAHENKVNRECDPKSWLGSFHSLESHMMDSSMSFASPIISEHVSNIPSWTWKDCTVPSFVRSTSPTMSELTFLSTNGDEWRH